MWWHFKKCVFNRFRLLRISWLCGSALTYIGGTLWFFDLVQQTITMWPFLTYMALCFFEWTSCWFVLSPTSVTQLFRFLWLILYHMTWTGFTVFSCCRSSAYFSVNFIPIIISQFVSVSALSQIADSIVSCHHWFHTLTGHRAFHPGFVHVHNTILNFANQPNIVLLFLPHNGNGC